MASLQWAVNSTEGRSQKEARVFIRGPNHTWILREDQKLACVRMRHKVVIGRESKPPLTAQEIPNYPTIWQLMGWQANFCEGIWQVKLSGINIFSTVKKKNKGSSAKSLLDSWGRQAFSALRLPLVFGPCRRKLQTPINFRGSPAASSHNQKLEPAQGHPAPRIR